MASPVKVPTCCSETWFGKKFFAPFQLPELSVQERSSLLFSSSRLIIAYMITNHSLLSKPLFSGWL